MQIQLLLELGGEDFLQHSLDNIKNTDAYWDHIWETTLTNADGASAYGLLITIAHFIAAVCVIFWIVRWANELGNGGNLAATLPKFIWLLTIVILLANNAAFVTNGSVGIRQIMTSWHRSILQIQLDGVQISSLINDQIATSQARDRISSLVAACNAMPAPDVAVAGLEDPGPDAPLPQRQVYAKLQCYRRIADEAQAIENNLNQAYCLSLAPNPVGVPSVGVQSCASMQRYFLNVGGAVLQFVNSAQQAMQSGQPIDFVGGATQAFAGIALSSSMGDMIKQILYVFQWCFVNLIQIGIWLNAMIAPIQVAMSTLPIERLKPIWGWLITYFSIGMTQIYYTLIVGTMSSVIAQTQFNSLNDLSFAFLLGIFAPVIAIALSTGGAWVAMRGITEGSAMIARAGMDAASTIATGGIRMFK